MGLEGEYWDRADLTFHQWFCNEIESVLRKEITVASGARRRKLDKDDFGFSRKQLRHWGTSPPIDEVPDGKKLRDVVGSVGFPHFSFETQRRLVILWVKRGMEAQNRFSNELIAFVQFLAEASPGDFLVRTAREACS